VCLATVYLSRNGEEEKIMQDVILLESTFDGVRLSTFFEEPKTVRARIERIDLLNSTITLVSQKDEE